MSLVALTDSKMPAHLYSLPLRNTAESRPYSLSDLVNDWSITVTPTSAEYFRCSYACPSPRLYIFSKYQSTGTTKQ